MYISGQSFRPVADGVGVGPEGGGRFGGVALKERPLVHPQADRKQPLRSEHFICFRIWKNLRNRQVRSFFHLCQRVITTYRRVETKTKASRHRKVPK
jgi:hypothetical protein